MVRITLVSIFALLVSLPSLAAKEILFEGFYKLTSQDQHIGFNIVRYEYDDSKKTFHSTYLTKISGAGNEVMESLSATASADDLMSPIDYKYVALVGKNSKTIEATFQKGKTSKEKTKMKLVITENQAKPKILVSPIASDVFLSTFLSYRMLRSQTGIQTNSKLQYNAIAEEDGLVISGSAEVLNEEKYKGFTAFKIKNTFKNVLFISHITDKGEALATSVPDSKIISELVPKASEAVGTIGLPEAVAKNLFKTLPLGSKNVVSQYFKHQETAPPKGGKTEGFPAGEGVMISPKNDKKSEGP